MRGRSWRAEFMAWARRDGMGSRTLKNFDTYCRLYEHYLADRGLDDPCAADRGVVAQFQAYVMTRESERGRPYSASTRAHILAWLRRLYRYLLAQERILLDPTLGMGRVRTVRPLPRALLSAGEMRRLLEAPDTKTAGGLRDRAMLELLYGTGLRFSEMADLGVGDVDLVERVLWVRRGKGGKDRVLPLGRWATYWLSRYLATSDAERRRRGSERIFLAARAERMSDQMVNWALERYAREAGIEKHVTAHAIRHTFATLLLKGGADIRKIQRLLGHEHLTTTEVYTHLDLTDLRKVQERCHPREKRQSERERGTLPRE